MEKKLPQGQDSLETEYSFYALSTPLIFPTFKCFSNKNAHEPKHCFFYYSLMIFILDSKHLHRTGRLLTDSDGRGGVSCYTEKNGLCSLWEAGQPNTCSPHWNTMKLSKWVVFCRLSGCGDGGGGLKQQRCFTLQYADDTSDIFIDSNKGQTTKAESKIEENTSRKTTDHVRHG